MAHALGVPTVGPTETAPGLLAGTYRRLAALCQALNVRVAEEPGSTAGRSASEQCLTGADLAQDPQALDAFIDAEADRTRDVHAHTVRRHVAASRVLHDYVWSVSLLMSGTWYLDQRVPRIRPRDVRLDLVPGALEIAPSASFACLADDRSATRLPGARVLVHAEALRAELRAAVADHMRPLITAIAPRARRGPRALWGLVADDLMSGIWYLGRVLNQEELAVRAATDLLPGGIPPFPGGADFRRLAGTDGRSHLTRTRHSCCLYYTISPAETCMTCPRTSDAARLRQLES